VLPQAISGLLPIGMAAALSPIPIIGVVLVLESAKARVNGPLFALGWVGGLVAVSTIATVAAGDASDPGSTAATGVNWVLTGIGVLFLLMAVSQWKKRPHPGETAELPGWMASIESVSPAKALALGAGLSAANPKNLALTLAAAAIIAEAGLDTSDTAIALAVFVAIGSATVVGAVLFALVAPTRAHRSLGRVKQFMAANNATIMMVVLLILGAKFLGDGLAAWWT